ncbi:MAG TPA: pyridoxal phosphate-dependent aminotransferase [Candidatus Acidoferrales bacterium]|nr:pyridoxal phosphate-dependent aminotransferase [Candidatus Acidoferrales bacterium]
MFASRTNWRLETNRLTRALEEHRRSGRELFDLTASNPTTCGLAYPEREILAALADPRALVYRPDSKGLREAREAVAEYYAGRVGFSGSSAPIDPERILLASGTSEAYSHIFRLLCEAGDEVLVPSPSYPLFEFLADLADIRLVPYPLLYDHGWQIDLASLRGAVTPRSRAVLVVHPNNPTGSFVKPREAAELAEICAAREMAIVADEVFLDYVSNAPPPHTFALSDATLTFTLSGLSKISLLPQMKLAWTIVSGPEAVVQTAIDRLEIIADTYLSPSTPVQLALPKFLSLRHSLQEQLQQRVSVNLSVLDSILRESKSLARLDGEGGWYAILRVPVTATDDDLTVALLERCSVLVHPGHFFNFWRDGFLVLGLISPENEFREGARRLLGFFAV